MLGVCGSEAAHADSNMRAGSDATVSDCQGTSEERNQYFEDRAIGPFRTLPHAGMAGLGLCGVVVFTVGLLLERFFDAALGVVFALLCWYIFVLMSERHRLKQHLDSRGEQDTCSSVADASSAASLVPNGPSELDLTGYANSLGVAMGDSVTGESKMLNKVLMSALAKEYLRCIAAIKCYETSYGKIQENPTQLSAAQIELPYDGASAQGLPTPQWTNPVPLTLPVSQPAMHSAGQFSSNSGDVTLALLEAGPDGEEPVLSSRTARSPRGPPSPESNRRRRSCGKQQLDCSEAQPGGPQLSSPDKAKVQHERAACNAPHEQQFQSFAPSAVDQAGIVGPTVAPAQGSGDAGFGLFLR